MKVSGVVLIYFLFALNSTLFSQSNPPKPDSICAEADVFCDSASLVGPWTLPDSVFNKPDKVVCGNATTTTGQFNNPLFFKFVATSSKVEIEVIVISLIRIKKDLGYQYGIIEGCDFNDNTNYLTCDGDSIQVNRVISVNGLEPGHTYTLYIDGYGGSKLVFNLRAIKGIRNLVVDKVDYFKVDGIGDFFANDTVEVCHNGNFKINVEGVNNAASFVWKVNGQKQGSDTSLIYRFSTANTVYKVEAQGYTDCASSPFGAIYFKIDTIPDQIFKDTTVCAGDLSGGIIPAWWLGGIINKPGVTRYKVPYPNGCYHWQQIKVIKLIEPIVSLDTVLCNVQSLIFGGVEVKKDTTIQVIRLTKMGCDSIINYRFNFMKFDATMSQLVCSSFNSYMLKINTVNFNQSSYDSIKVKWFLNNIPIGETKTLEFYPVTQKGTYTAVVTLYKNNWYCSFDMNSVQLDILPDAAFVVDKNVICETDSLVLSISNYFSSATYSIVSSGCSNTFLSNGKYQLKYSIPGTYNINVEADFNGCKTTANTSVEVKKELEKPVVSCVKSTNTSIEFDWADSDSDCLDKYEIYIDGVFYKNSSGVATESLTGLSIGQNVNIKVKAFSDCVCPPKIDSTTCKALPCPEQKIEIVGLPAKICYDDLNNSFKLNPVPNPGGIATWSGNSVGSDGIVTKAKLTEGDNIVYLEYKIGECVYKFDTSITVYPEVRFELNYSDISCHGSNNGVVNITPLHGSPDFVLSLNGKQYPSMSISDLKDGKYDVILTDKYGCDAKSSFTLTDPAMPSFEIHGVDKVKFNKDYIYFYTSDANNIDSITWLLNGNILCANRFCDSVKIMAEDDFQLCIEMIYSNGCITDECMDVRVNKEFDLYVPNIFSPNFDGFNDYFSVKSVNGAEVKIKTMQVYDRWGEMLYKKDDFTYGNHEDSVSWDGRFKEKPCYPGVYVYYIEYLDVNGEPIRLAGDVTLVR
jgi:gliding motility-associated-like protein